MSYHDVSLLVMGTMLYSSKRPSINSAESYFFPKSVPSDVLIRDLMIKIFLGQLFDILFEQIIFLKQISDSILI